VSQENVEIVRQATEASQRHDNETALSLYDPEVEMERRGFDVSVEVYRGLDGVRAWFRDFLDPLAHLTVTVDEWIDAGDDVIAVVHTTGRGRKSGVPVEHRDAHVWTLRNGKLWHLSIYPTRNEALKAVGLEE
jgi:ketosteroid isomerase-like protein